MSVNDPVHADDAFGVVEYEVFCECGHAADEHEYTPAGNYGKCTVEIGDPREGQTEKCPCVSYEPDEDNVRRVP